MTSQVCVCVCGVCVCVRVCVCACVCVKHWPHHLATMSMTIVNKCQIVLEFEKYDDLSLASCKLFLKLGLNLNLQWTLQVDDLLLKGLTK